MSDGKACGKQAAPYTGNQPGEGSVVTSRNSAASENEVYLYVIFCLSNLSVVKLKRIHFQEDSNLKNRNDWHRSCLVDARIASTNAEVD
jgi:hypothetical protein